ncbi:acyl-CoA thioesterase [Desulfacinum infernum DSM 9756]|uniref:Acyl-CoA thioesterase n=2 Tax=Desulfacinum infernum TaxID=35837 RepID=A0A1M5FW85_9BACT|nr:acyl-CoA thioesterase [Desulfacinum infernum DSM 9756]
MGVPSLEHVRERLRRIPALRLLGVDLLALEPGLVRLRLPFREDFCNSMGMVQGGFVTAVADAAGGLAVLSKLESGWKAPTIELKINFLEPIRGSVEAVGRVLRTGTGVGVSSMEIFLEDGTLAAAGIATYRLVGPTPRGHQ